MSTKAFFVIHDSLQIKLEVKAFHNVPLPGELIMKSVPALGSCPFLGMSFVSKVSPHVSETLRFVLDSQESA